MNSKVLEIRDRITRIDVLAINCSTYDSLIERYYMRYAGFSPDYPQVIVLRLDTMKAQYDPDEWGGRTMPVAHTYIRDNYNSLEPGQVVDVEFILNEVDKPKVPERLA